MPDDRHPTAAEAELRSDAGSGRPPSRGGAGGARDRAPRGASAAGGCVAAAGLSRRAALAAGGIAVAALALPGGRPAQAHELLAAATTIDEIRVAKGARTMDLLRGGAVVGSYRIALGFAPDGHKQRRGDGRTPEGSYRIIALNRWSRFHLSLRIDYPNAEDRARAAAAGVDPGGDIMIHGLAPQNRHLGVLASYKDWTEGCIAVSNEEIEEIVAMTPIGTPVVITA